MVRNRVRKTMIGNTNAEVMEAAARAVVSREKSLNEAALEFSIPKTTLFRYVAKLKTSTDSTPVSFRPHYDVRRIFSDNEEKMLVEYLLTASKLHHGLAPKAARELAYQFAEANRRDMPRNWVLNMTAGEDWFYRFMKRHTELSVRAPESTSLACSMHFQQGKHVGTRASRIQEITSMTS